MTKKEAIKRLKEIDIRDALQEDYDALDMAIEALEREQKADQFTNWVAEKIFDGACEDEAFAEICCRKLAKLGIVRANGDEWELVEPMESEAEQ